MKASIDDIVSKVRTAIDDITRDADEEFTKDADTEIKQAVVLAAMRVSKAAPLDMLEPVTAAGMVQTENKDGSGNIVVPKDYLCLVELRLKSWGRSIYTLMDSGSNEAAMQISMWSRGTAQKPKAMLAHDSLGRRIIRYWSAGRKTQRQKDGRLKQVYDHAIDTFAYEPVPSINGDELKAGVTEECMSHIIYMAAGIFLTGKKEDGLAAKCFQLAAFESDKQ